ncbi:MAG: SOS response-associated peptidase [Thermoleophilaceae bacterium]|nr:SOS response-associated peptidase [Thermoleophilaceae bacterium]
MENMCGRYTLRQLTAIEHAFAFELRDLPASLLQPRFNVAPGQLVLALSNASGDIAAQAVPWGIHAPWNKGKSAIRSAATSAARETVVINARLEKLQSSRFWSPMLGAGRCAIPADGFFEWQAARDGQPKQPFLFELAGQQPFAFAGLLGQWHDSQDELKTGCVVVTTTPNELVADVHDRMPVMLRGADVGNWLQPNTEAALAVAGPLDSTLMTARPVSRRVNDPTHDSEDCVGAPGPLAGDQESLL